MSTSESRKPVDPNAPSQRFLFETSFDTEAIGAEEEAAEPTFSLEEMEAAREAAYAEGDAAGRQDVVNGIEKQLLNGLGRLVEQMAALSEEQALYQEGLTARSVELALKALRKMFPALAERQGLVEIEAVLAECLQEARTEPRISIRIAGPLVEPLQERVDALSAAAGHEGTITILADDTLGDSDCRVEWAQGGAERVVQNMWQEFEAAAQRIFKAPGEDSAQTPEAGDEIPPDTGEDAEPPIAADDPEMAVPEAPDTPDAPDTPSGDTPINGFTNGAAFDGEDPAGEPATVTAPDPAVDPIDDPPSEPDPVPDPAATTEIPGAMPEGAASQDTPNAS